MKRSKAACSRREKVRERILGHARELFAAEGVHGLSMRRLAEQSGYSPAALYKYFQSKDDIVIAMRERFFEHLVQRMDEILDRGGDLGDRFRGGCRAYMETALEDPELYAAGFNISLGQNVKDGPGLFEGESFRAQAFLRLRGKIAQLMEAGAFKPGDAHTIAFNVWSAMHGLTSLLICLPKFPGIDRQKIIDQHIDVMIAGLKSTSVASKSPG